MKKITWDTISIKDKEQLHEELAKLLKFPKHYGKNLDALYDCLSSDVKLPLTLIWKNYAAVLKNLGQEAEKFLQTLKDFSQEEPDFKVELE